MSNLSEYLSVVAAALLSTGGIGLLFVGAYLTGFGWKGIASVVAGVSLFGVGLLVLLRQDSEVADKLIDLLRDLLLGT